MGQWLSERLGQQFVIENRPGASTTIGTEAVVRAPADGYTLLLIGTPSAINTTLFESKLSYNFLHIGLEPSLELADQRRQAGHFGERIEQRPCCVREIERAIVGGVGRKCLPKGHERRSAASDVAGAAIDLLGKRLHITLEL